MKISARFRPIFDFKLKWKRPRAEPSWAENPSVRAMARASSARTHHYKLPYLALGCYCKIYYCQKNPITYLNKGCSKHNISQGTEYEIEA